MSAPKIALVTGAGSGYQQEATPLLIRAGKEHGSCSWRDWAAKGVALPGVKAVLAESFERIHRTNLVGMGVLPLQFVQGDNVATLKLATLQALPRVDTPQEAEYFRNGGILPFVLRQLAAQ